MWSYSGFFYRGEQYGPDSLLELFTRLGASEEQQARILAEPHYEVPYEQVWRELTGQRFGRMPKVTEFSTEDWPAMLGTWHIAAHSHPAGLPPLKFSEERRDKHQDFCPCEAGDGYRRGGVVEDCPLYAGRDD